MVKKLAIVLGIRPDVIRCSLILNQIRKNRDFETVFIWSGQHYSDNLKDIFFRELGVAPPEIELNATGQTDAEISGQVITKLHPVLEKLQPEATVFLGDTNTVMGSLASAQLNIPIVHIEGCMRSYDWRMPEEKYRTTIDHLSDIIYCYYDEYKQQGIDEGLNPANILVVTNLIVDVLQAHYFDKKKFYDDMASQSFFSSKGLEKDEYYLMTCHRRENVQEKKNLEAIVNLLKATDRAVYFPASYRTQKQLQEFKLELPSNVKMVDPIGYQEILALMVNSRGVLTDSGTVVEETSVLGVPTVQIRKSTERPQVYDTGGCVKFDPDLPEKYPTDQVLNKLESLRGKTWEHGLGDGKASERIVKDLSERVLSGGFQRHKPENYHLKIQRSYQEDGL